MRRSSAAFFDGLMNNNLGTKWSYRSAIEFKVSVDAGLSGEFGMVLGGYEKIGGDVVLMYEVAPFGGRKIGITGC